jgi:hypothetical protein
MKNDRRAILSLIALGRITPHQAERLLHACNESRENLWLVACVVLGLLAWAVSLQGLPALFHIARSWFQAGAMHRSLALIAQFKGGLQ